MMLLRRRAASPVLSQQTSASPALSSTSDASPYLDACPPTPHWNSLPSVTALRQSSNPSNAMEAQIAWTAYQTCSRRLNGACAANRSQSVGEQRAWWEETLNACQKAILLNSAILNKNHHLETAKNLELLENAYHMIQTMIESLTSREQIMLDEIPKQRSLSDSFSTASTLMEEEAETMKPFKRFGFSSKFARAFKGRLSEEPRMEIEKIGRPDSILY